MNSRGTVATAVWTHSISWFGHDLASDTFGPLIRHPSADPGGTTPPSWKSVRSDVPAATALTPRSQHPYRRRPVRRSHRPHPMPHVENDDREWHEHPQPQDGVSTQLPRDVHRHGDRVSRRAGRLAGHRGTAIHRTWHLLRHLGPNRKRLAHRPQTCAAVGDHRDLQPGRLTRATWLVTAPTTWAHDTSPPAGGSVVVIEPGRLDQPLVSRSSKMAGWRAPFPYRPVTSSAPSRKHSREPRTTGREP